MMVLIFLTGYLRKNKRKILIYIVTEVLPKCICNTKIKSSVMVQMLYFHGITRLRYIF